MANNEGKLSYIEMRVETAIPWKGHLYWLASPEALLDAFVRNAELPWGLRRLELVSPEDGEVTAYELVLPFRNGVRIGPLGGIDQLLAIAPYDAIYREAGGSGRPFYRLLCAFRIYDGTTEISPMASRAVRTT